MFAFSIQLYLDIVMAKDFEKYLHLCWGAAYSCMVLIKEESNILHLDMSDAKQLMNYIICFGEFKNVYVLLPQPSVKAYLLALAICILDVNVWHICMPDIKPLPHDAQCLPLAYHFTR
jgi:hypothetical protein